MLKFYLSLTHYRYLDKKDKSAMDGRVDCMSNVYKKLTGKDVKFLFHSPVTDD